MSMCTHVLFDLDGTLIDSAPAILASYEDAFARLGLQPVRALDNSIIGPPLGATLRLLLPAADSEQLAALAQAFKDSYDGAAYRETLAYEGVGLMLGQLRAAGCTLAIATNKRLLPTRLILDHLGWTPLFSAVYALDMHSPPLPHKSAMLGRLLSEQRIDPTRSVYVGDRAEDGEAADDNHLPFILASWGYGSLPAAQMREHWREATQALTLPAMVGAAAS